MRINITLPDYLVQETDKRAAELGTSRSGYIAMALSFKAQYDDMMEAMPQMIGIMGQIKPHLERLEQANVKKIEGE
jgi:metal-responsive CopG/Arc/MetJ family transcriptional regulator